MVVREPMIVSAAVEGLVDEAVLRRIVHHAGSTLGTVFGKNGKTRLRQKVNGYNQAARFGPWVILIDLDQDASCAPPLREQWLPDPMPLMCFRVAVREVEAWLLADRERAARFLGVPVSRIPRDPEVIVDPKQTTVELARASRHRDIREDMVPTLGGGRFVGPAYTSRLIEFTLTHWQPGVAAQRADSLRRCVNRIQELLRAS